MIKITRCMLHDLGLDDWKGGGIARTMTSMSLELGWRGEGTAGIHDFYICAGLHIAIVRSLKAKWSMGNRLIGIREKPGRNG